MALQVSGRVVAAGQPPRHRQFGVEVEAGFEVQRLQVLLVGRPELDDRVAQRIAGRRAQAAMGRHVHQPVELEEHLDVVARAVAGGELVHALGHQRGADAAGGAETAALVGEEVGEVARDLEHVARAVEDHEGAGGRHVLEGDAAAELGGRQAHARRPADLHRLRVARAAVLEDLCDAGAEGVFVEAGALAVAARPSGSWCRWTWPCRSPAHQAPPRSAMWVAAQKVSTLLTMVGCPR